MSEFVFEQKMGRDEALKIAARKGDWLWHIVFHGLPLAELRLMYIEFLLIKLSSEYKPGIFDRLRGAVKKSFPQEVEVIVDGTNGRAAMVADHPPIIVMELDDEKDHVQRSDMDEDQLLRNAQKLAMKVAHRFMGGLPLVSVKEYRSVFRPYWVAFYGQMQEGSKVRYVPIAADGGKDRRVR
jgi:hypothetical protein